MYAIFGIGGVAGVGISVSNGDVGNAAINLVAAVAVGGIAFLDFRARGEQQTTFDEVYDQDLLIGKDNPLYFEPKGDDDDDDAGADGAGAGGAEGAE